MEPVEMSPPQLSNPEQPRPASETLPTMYDLPSEYPEELGLPDEFHEFQPQLLRETCLPTTVPSEQVFIGTDLNVYYDSRHPGWHKRPDWFLVLGVERATQQSELRWSYVIWQEMETPFLVVELLSPGTEAEDLGQTLREVNRPPTKWQTYEQALRVPYYAIFDRYENDFRLYQLVGTQYQLLTLEGQYHWFEELGLGLGIWQGEYEGVFGKWLRWKDSKGEWILTAEQKAEREQQRAEREQQRAEREQQRAEQEQQRADQAQQEAQQVRQRADRLAEKLRELGIEPDDV